MTPHLEKIARDLGSVAPLAAPSVASPSLANEPATPSDVVVSRDLLERSLSAMFQWGAHCQKKRSFTIVTDDGTENACDHLVRNALHVLGVKASQSPLASDGEVQRSETTEPKTIQSILTEGEGA